jgi:FeS assembly SUF system protein
MDKRQKEEITRKVINTLRSIYDPEIPVDIWELGLIYDLNVDNDSNVYVKMTLTAPSCPVAESLPIQVQERIRAIEGVKDVYVDLVWDPPWSMDLMSDEAKLKLGFL